MVFFAVSDVARIFAGLFLSREILAASFCYRGL
jgi:hypothetical protein